MTNRFRELERPQTGRLKDVVLMATVTSFESLRIPRKPEMRQFAELFEPLFLGSSDEARRQAAAALSQCAHVPDAVANLIGSMPISIAAIFLTRSKAISDRTLIWIIRTQGPAHANAIARRDELSPSVIDALVEHHHAAGQFRTATHQPVATASQPVGDPSTDRVARENKLRDEIKALAGVGARGPEAPYGVRPIGALHQALLMRFARSGEAVLFANALADAMEASQELAERILLDVSGQQLATTLVALDFPVADMAPLLSFLYPHLGERLGGSTRADALIGNVERKESVELVDAWLRADGAARPARYESHLAQNRRKDPRRQEARPSVTVPDQAKQLRRHVAKS